ncbi:MAG: proline dehydrogenase [Nocardioides sp.]|nr:proline dehydrogenase [Nocardioides sp.]
MPNRLLLIASENKSLERIANSSRLAQPLVRRYVAGTRLDDALEVTQELNRTGIEVSLDLLGESVTDLAQSEAATSEYLHAIDRMHTYSPRPTISIKLSQLGITLDPAQCEKTLRLLLEAARERNCVVEVDMEHSSAGRGTLAIFRRIQGEFPETRLAVQAYLRSTFQDLTEFETPPRIRLVKGAFDEKLDVAIRDAADVTAQYNYLSEWALRHLPDPAFGTHDGVCIDHIKRVAREQGLDKRDFEFQMLHGVRRPLQEQLVREGYRVRVYLPYGDQWYPYLTRRMAERPANLLLFLRSLRG